MEKIYTGKTKDVYRLNDGNYLLKFKDDATGTDGKFDPGANTVGLSIEGMGKANLEMSEYYFTLLNNSKIATHFISADTQKCEMLVKPAEIFGKGLEVIVRYQAAGSFIRRYGLYAANGQPLDAFCEITLKDDERGDPPITKDALAALGILTPDEYETLVKSARNISNIIRDDLLAKGLTLIDIKLEFGRSGEIGEIILIDEIAAGNMRVMKDGEVLEPMELCELNKG